MCGDFCCIENSNCVNNALLRCLVVLKSLLDCNQESTLKRGVERAISIIDNIIEIDEEKEKK